MIVRMWMTPKVISISPDEHLGQAAALMSQHEIRRLPVVTPAQGGRGRLVGMLSHGDVLQAAPAGVNPFSIGGPAAMPPDVLVGQVMRSPVITTNPDAPIEQVAELMRTSKIGALPVLEHERVVGLVTESDIFRAFVSLFSVPGELARITFDVSLCDDPFALVSAIAGRHDVHLHGMMSSVIEGRPVYVLWVAGPGVNGLQRELWSGGHVVLSILHV
jgi:acetoin utilization protein AcuB